MSISDEWGLPRQLPFFRIEMRLTDSFQSGGLDSPPQAPACYHRDKVSSKWPGRSSQRRLGPVIDLAGKVGWLLHAYESEAVAFELPFMLADRLFNSTEFARLH